MDKRPAVIANPWEQLRQFTAARIALGRTGASLPTQPQLAFQLAHARARDAVHLPLEADKLQAGLAAAGVATAEECHLLDSAAADRLEYLQRPDLGRRLSDDSRERLLALKQPAAGSDGCRYDLAVVIADGLSALAISQNAAPFLACAKRALAAEHYRLAPLAIVRQGRVAIGDEVAGLLGARALLLLIGERPGLSSPDSMGLYLSWRPNVGMSDAKRNCISNVRPAGLPYQAAAARARFLLTEMARRGVSGIGLKDETTDGAGLPPVPARNFLLDRLE